MVKLVHMEVEGAHQSIRRARQKGMDAAKKAFKGASEDDRKRAEKEVRVAAQGGAGPDPWLCRRSLQALVVAATPPVAWCTRHMHQAPPDATDTHPPATSVIFNKPNLFIRPTDPAAARPLHRRGGRAQEGKGRRAARAQGLNTTRQGGGGAGGVQAHPRNCHMEMRHAVRGHDATFCVCVPLPCLLSSSHCNRTSTRGMSLHMSVSRWYVVYVAGPAAERSEICWVHATSLCACPARTQVAPLPGSGAAACGVGARRMKTVHKDGTGPLHGRTQNTVCIHPQINTFNVSKAIATRISVMARLAALLGASGLYYMVDTLFTSCAGWCMHPHGGRGRRRACTSVPRSCALQLAPAAHNTPVTAHPPPPRPATLPQTVLCLALSGGALAAPRKLLADKAVKSDKQFLPMMMGGMGASQSMAAGPGGMAGSQSYSMDTPWGKATLSGSMAMSNPLMRGAGGPSMAASHSIAMGGSRGGGGAGSSAYVDGSGAGASAMGVGGGGGDGDGSAAEAGAEAGAGGEDGGEDGSAPAGGYDYEEAPAPPRRPALKPLSVFAGGKRR